MIVSPAFAGKRYAVLGLARSGMAAAEALLASGAQVTAWDRREGPREELADRATIVDPLELDLAGFDGMVLTPGVPLNTHPIADHARAAGVPLIGDIELFAQARATLPPHKVVGVTGTNGKSTTTALIHHICKTAGVPTVMGGNIGLPILAQQPLSEGGVYVLELSSYQIDLTLSLDCDVAILLNVTPDHLDRYDSFEAYARSKERLLEMQDALHTIVFGSSFHAQRRPTYDTYFGARPKVFCQPTYTMQDPYDLWDPFDAGRHLSVQKDWPALQGPHNAENAGAALLACLALGLNNEQIDTGLRTYPGLPHRMERIAEHNGVLFINDSKATNPASAAPALAAYPRVHWICGGLPKGDNLDECAPHFGHVAAAYTIGEAVQRAIAAAKPGEVVLFSPACASFDQFRDYEIRGDAFRKLVSELTGQAAPPGAVFTARSAA